jgi:hypothetical protein
MTWAEHHRKSEELASLASELANNGQVMEARVQYRLAAAAEMAALEVLDSGKERTLGVTVVSTVALWFKGRELLQAKRLAYRWLAAESLPAFAVRDLEELLREILVVESDAVAQT